MELVLNTFGTSLSRDNEGFVITELEKLLANIERD